MDGLGSGESIWRNVADKVEAYFGMGTCMSGSDTGAMCGGYVDDVSDTACDGTVCTFNLARARRSDGVRLSDNGDSGGPVIGRIGNYTASARGIIVGGDAILDPSIGPISTRFRRSKTHWMSWSPQRGAAGIRKPPSAVVVSMAVTHPGVPRVPV